MREVYWLCYPQDQPPYKWIYRLLEPSPRNFLFQIKPSQTASKRKAFIRGTTQIATQTLGGSYCNCSSRLRSSRPASGVEPKGKDGDETKPSSHFAQTSRGPSDFLGFAYVDLRYVVNLRYVPMLSNSSAFNYATYLPYACFGSCTTYLVLRITHVLLGVRRRFKVPGNSTLCNLLPGSR